MNYIFFASNCYNKIGCGHVHCPVMNINRGPCKSPNITYNSDFKSGSFDIFLQCLKVLVNSNPQVLETEGEQN